MKPKTSRIPQSLLLLGACVLLLHSLNTFSVSHIYNQKTIHAAFEEPQSDIHIVVKGMDFGVFDKVLLNGIPINSQDIIKRLTEIITKQTHTYTHARATKNSANLINSLYPLWRKEHHLDKPPNKPFPSNMISLKLERSFITDRSLHAWMHKQHLHPYPTPITLTWKNSSHNPQNDPQSLHLVSSRPLLWSIEAGNSQHHPAQNALTGGYKESVIITAKNITTRR